jgi:ribonuclease-3
MSGKFERALTILPHIEEIQEVVSVIATNKNLYQQGLALGLDPFIVKNPSQQGSVAGRIVMATTMEAILGAVYYDSSKNLEACERVMAAMGLSFPE